MIVSLPKPKTTRRVVMFGSSFFFFVTFFVLQIDSFSRTNEQWNVVYRFAYVIVTCNKSFESYRFSWEKYSLCSEHMFELQIFCHILLAQQSHTEYYLWNTIIYIVQVNCRKSSICVTFDKYNSSISYHIKCVRSDFPFHA